jgi:renalase
MQQPVNVAIIGAGIAGLSCAKALSNNGFEVTLFEKSRGVSGRLSTRVRPAWQCDHGAQYFTAKTPQFKYELEKWLMADVAQLWQPHLAVLDGHDFSSKATESASSISRYVGYPCNSSPAKWLAQSLNVVTQSTVCAIHNKASQWQITTKELGLNPMRFDCLVLAMPAPQAAILLQDVNQALATLCNSVTMRPCYALMLRLTSGLKRAFQGFFINAGPLSWIALDSAKPGRLNDGYDEVWVLHAASDWSELHVDDDQPTVAQLMLAEFMRVMQLNGADTAEISTTIAQLTTASNYDLHRWLYADCDHYLAVSHQFDHQQKIGLCGDWLNGGKVEGAWLSGFNLAHVMMKQSVI